ncbi:ferritin-like domain-containing protein [Hymenobacter persicinus]|uniref:Ferritin-like domain-containing protein n=1 Tax=Hymenobacter persicinus TaxID=2025506 RepID=A0A4Q5LJQ1_9BACT|nr:ferritin-like domain-containing protein [Hymenobacter persicinus]RYU84252.1 ferritin-like domain-containing protein [Hymenobacter persicinus]
MSKLLNSGGDEAEFAKPLYVPIKRRSFFMYAGATAGATALLLSSCNDDDDDTSMPGMVDVGSGDTGVLNYAYALEQLEAAFYTMVKAGDYYKNAVAAEKAILDDIAAHEIIHREFFKAALSTSAIKPLEVDFSSINFGDRTAVLGAAKTFEDLGVAAYNGAGQYISSADYLTLAGKIVSVEARHAALIRDLISNGSFVNDVVSPTTGLELSKSPVDVANAANMYLKDGFKINVGNIK